MSDEVAIGIDLGTSYSCVSYVENGVPVVIPNEWGERTHASCGSFLPDGSVLVGNAAKRNIITNAENTVYSAKRLIGRFYFSDEVKKAQAVMPYTIVEGPGNSVRIEVLGRTFSLPEISALVLKELKAVAESYLGREVTKAVITVPAYFNDNQRQATKDAGRLAGLEVLRIINEPTAAALAYGLDKQVNGRFAVFDLGGGTFDGSILALDEGVFQVMATKGDTQLGGDDFDRGLLRFALERHLGRAVDWERDVGDQLRQLLYAARSAKERLSTENEAEVDLGDVRVPVTRADFEGLPEVRSLIDRALRIARMALRDAGLSTGEVDGVVMVGGMTRVPRVRREV